MSNNAPSRFSLPESTRWDFLIPYAFANSAIAVAIGELMYYKGDSTGSAVNGMVAYPGVQLASSGNEANDQEQFAALFVGVANSQVLSTEINANKRITLLNDCVCDFACPSQVWHKGDPVGIYSNGTTIDSTQVDALKGEGGQIGVVVRDSLVATTTVRVRLKSRYGDFIGTEPAGAGGGSWNFPRNLLDGGDSTTNPWQRGTSITGLTDVYTATSKTSGPYTADRWFAGGASTSSITVAQVAATDVAGFADNFKFGSISTTDTSQIFFGQILEALDVYRLQGREVTFSFWAKSGSAFSGGSLGVQVVTGTSADEGLTTLANVTSNKSKFNGWTGFANNVTTAPAGTVTSGVASQAITATATRYTFTALVPTGAKELAVLISYTPGGTSSANDFVSLYGLQLEDGAQATDYEHKDVELELALCQRYFFVVNEVNGLNLGTGAPTGSNTQGYDFWLPTPMRVAPTVLVNIGGIKVIIDGGAATAVVGLAAGTAHSPTVISLAATNTVTAAAHSLLLQGSAATGWISASADL